MTMTPRRLFKTTSPSGRAGLPVLGGLGVSQGPAALGSGWLRLVVGLAIASSLALAGCGVQPDTDQPGWYLEKTGPDTVRLLQVLKGGERKTWDGQLTDSSPKSSWLSPLPSGQDNGLFRWSRPGCADLSFVLSRQGLTCTTCMEPTVFVPFTASCPVDQTRLPVQGWLPIGLERAK